MIVTLRVFVEEGKGMVKKAKKPAKSKKKQPVVSGKKKGK